MAIVITLFALYLGSLKHHATLPPRQLQAFCVLALIPMLCCYTYIQSVQLYAEERDVWTTANRAIGGA